MSAKPGGDSSLDGPGRIVAPALALLLVLGLFWPVLGFPFVSLDDVYGVVENPGIRELSWNGVRFLFLEDQRDFRYFPLSYLSFAVDYALFGLDPRGFHATNLALHLANTGLVFALVRRLTGDRLAAAVACVLFGVHPLQVESVAWVSSRKNALFFLFYLGSIFAYLGWARPPGPRPRLARASLAASVLLFLLALCAKTTAVTLPAVLVLVDHHLRPQPPPGLARFLGESLPSKLLYLPPIAFTWWMTRQLARRSPFLAEYAFGAVDWTVIALHNVFFYVAKTLAPFGLGVFYPLPDDSAPWLPARFHVYALLALALIAVCLWSRTRHRIVFLGTAWYLATIAPMAIGPAFFSDMPLLAADRYAYQSGVGLFLLVGAGFSGLWRSPRPAGGAARAALAAGAAALLAGSLLLARQQVQVWRGTIPLYEQTVRHHPSDAFYYRLALAYAREDRLARAFDALERAETAPHQIFFARIFVYQMQISDLYRRKGDFLRAAELLESAIDSTPNAFEPVDTRTPLAYRYLADLYRRGGDPARADAALARAETAELVPRHYFESHWFTLAPEASRRLLERRVAEAPEDAVAWFYLGQWFRVFGEPERAEACLERAAALGLADPALP
ncbi:MAG: tetratricopeptide repeat protein [Myxococcota bacterium]